jgi:hypothetical protein
MKVLKRKSDKRFFKAQRERTRMLAINKALLYLRSILQSSLVNGSSDFQHLPKIETLKLAKNYIKILQNQLDGEDYSHDEFIEILCTNLKNSTAKLLKRLVLLHG